MGRKNVGSQPLSPVEQAEEWFGLCVPRHMYRRGDGKSLVYCQAHRTTYPIARTPPERCSYLLRMVEAVTQRDTLIKRG